MSLVGAPSQTESAQHNHAQNQTSSEACTCLLDIQSCLCILKLKFSYLNPYYLHPHQYMLSPFRTQHHFEVHFLGQSDPTMRCLSSSWKLWVRITHATRPYKTSKIFDFFFNDYIYSSSDTSPTYGFNTLNHYGAPPQFLRTFRVAS